MWFHAVEVAPVTCQKVRSMLWGYLSVQRSTRAVRSVPKRGCASTPGLAVYQRSQLSVLLTPPALQLSHELLVEVLRHGSTAITSGSAGVPAAVAVAVAVGVVVVVVGVRKSTWST